MCAWWAWQAAGDLALREIRWQADQLRRQMAAAAAAEEFEEAARLKKALHAARAELAAAEQQRVDAAAAGAAAAAGMGAGAGAEAEGPPARGWAAAAALSDREGVVFGGLAGSDAAPERLGDAWRVRLDVEYYGTEDYI